MRRHRQILNSKNLEVQKRIYSERIRNLTRIFGMLILFNMFTALPFIITSIVGLIIGLDRMPPQIYASVFVLFLFSNVTNPIIQAYFRKDLYDTIKKYFTRVMSIFKKKEVGEQDPVVRSGTTDSSSENSVVKGKGGSVARGVNEGVIVVAGYGEGSRGINSSCNGSRVHPSSCPLPYGEILELRVIEETVAFSSSVVVECRGGGEGEKFEIGDRREREE